MLRNLILYASMDSYIGLVHNNKHRHSFNGPQINLFLPHILQGKNINFVSLVDILTQDIFIDYILSSAKVNDW